MADEEAAAIPSETVVEEDEDDGMPEGDPLWLITFGDCISLLLTFFVLLLSFSTFDNPEAVKNVISFQTTKITTGKSVVSGTKYQKFDIDHRNTELQRILTHTKGTFNLGDEVIKDEIQEIEDLDNVTFTLEQLREVLEENKLEDSDEIGVKKENRFTMTFDPGIYFHEGSDELLDESVSMVKNAIPLMAEIPNDIIITGYADDLFEVPEEEVKERQKELAVARADRIAQFLIISGGIPPERLSIDFPKIYDETSDKEKENLKKTTLTITGALEGFYSILKKNQANGNRNARS